ncbi:PREDICTED: nitric oxide synthase-interacting protein homolog [Papilio polytes]|uniref:nitric oxide synthase-interacting protein homolog n=1 Tax=Papilio polytes TaxID=76194 RepID=UPI0006769882|nr:PREDICTED: nitric oxide synthase-interacting protein homolog [Papilio polytes]
MTRHARNCTAGAVYTYHEKKKDAAASGYGTQSERVGKDSVKSFDCCSLTLQPCRNPVVTKEGYLFDKEAILEYIIAKKTEYTRKLKQYEKQLKKDEAEKKELADAEKEANLIKFMSREKNISNSGSSSQPSTSSSVSNLANGKHKELPSFWVPSQLPDAKLSKVEKPDPTVYCPISGKPLKMKDLIEVNWTLVKDPDDKKSLIAKENRYMCPVTHDILSNAVPCAIIRTTGHVVTMECVEKIIKKDWLHPLTGDKLKEKDIIPMQRGGTGYALTNQNLEGKNERPVLQA